MNDDKNDIEPEVLEIHKRWNRDKREFENIDCYKWISIKDRLPGDGELILTLRVSKYEEVSAIICLFFNPDKFLLLHYNELDKLHKLDKSYFSSERKNCDEDVTHWIRLPLLPK